MEELLFEDSLLENMEVVHHQESQEPYADDFLSEDSLLESMEVVSFEERDIDEVVRENAHALLDAEMDLEEILYESNMELVTEGTLSKIGTKIKELWQKLKAMVKKFIDWVISLIKKDKSASKSSSTTTKEDNGKGGSVSQKEDDVKIPDAPSKGDIRLFNAKGAARVIGERFAILQKMVDNSDHFDANQTKNEIINIKELCFKDLEKLWYNGDISEVIEVSNGTVYYHNVNSDFEDLLRGLSTEITDLENLCQTNKFNSDPERISTVKLLISVSQSILAQLQKIFKEDKANRMTVIRADVKANGNRRGV